MTTESKSIDITPTWRGLLALLVEVAANAESADARRTAMAELLRLADIADDLGERIKRARAYDQSLNAAGRAPDGDDYNRLALIFGIE